MGSPYAALQRLLQFSRTSPGAERAELMDWHLHVEPLEQLHQEQLEREPQEQFLQMDRDPPRCGAGNTGTWWSLSTSAAPAWRWPTFRSLGTPARGPPTARASPRGQAME